MSFNFGAGAPSGGGFNFGTSSASTTNNTNSQQATGGFGSTGFSFGGQQQTTGTASPSVAGFNFGTPTAANPTPGGIMLGSTPSATPSGGITLGTQKTANVTFGFGAAAPAASSASSGISFGNTATFGISAISGSNAATGMAGFGKTTQTAAQPLPTQTASTPSSGFSFGSSATGGAAPGGFGTTTATKPAQAATTGGFGLGGQTQTTGASATQSTTGIGGLGGFSAPKAQSSTTQGMTLSGLLSSTQNQPQGATQPVLGQTGGANTGQPVTGFTSGGKGVTQPSSAPQGQFTVNPTQNLTQSTTLTGAPKIGNGLGTLNSGQSTQGLSLGATSAPGATVGFAAPSTASTGLKFGTTTTTSSGGFGLTLGATAAATTSSSFTLGKPVQATTSTTPATLSTTTTTTQSAASVPQMNYTQLEESINKWTLDLEEQEKVFLEQATQVNAWDRLLIDNGEKITQLNTDVERVKIDQTRLDQELDFINAQQRELEDMLVPLEQSMEQLPPINYQQHADLEREHTYKLAENIDGQLKHMSQDLKEIIEHINANNTSQDKNDPVNQIAKILNAHMDSLQWVDQNTALLQRRVDEVAKTADLRRKEQERNFRLAYD